MSYRPHLLSSCALLLLCIILCIELAIFSIADENSFKTFSKHLLQNFAVRINDNPDHRSFSTFFLLFSLQLNVVFLYPRGLLSPSLVPLNIFEYPFFFCSHILKPFQYPVQVNGQRQWRQLYTVLPAAFCPGLSSLSCCIFILSRFWWRPIISTFCGPFLNHPTGVLFRCPNSSSSILETSITRRLYWQRWSTVE